VGAVKVAHALKARLGEDACRVVAALARRARRHDGRTFKIVLREYVSTNGLYTKGTRAHTHRKLIREWLWELKGSSLNYISRSLGGESTPRPYGRLGRNARSLNPSTSKLETNTIHKRLGETPCVVTALAQRARRHDGRTFKIGLRKYVSIGRNNRRLANQKPREYTRDWARRPRLVTALAGRARRHDGRTFKIGLRKYVSTGRNCRGMGCLQHAGALAWRRGPVCPRVRWCRQILTYLLTRSLNLSKSKPETKRIGLRG